MSLFRQFLKEARRDEERWSRDCSAEVSWEPVRAVT